MTSLDKSDWYDNQPWLSRRLRDFWYLTVPFCTVKFWVREQRRELEDEDDWRMSFRNCWGLAVGLANCKQKNFVEWKASDERTID